MSPIPTRILLSLAFMISSPSYSITDWSSSARIEPGESRKNILELPADEWEEYIDLGKQHTVDYPVNVTGLLIPYKATKNFLDGKDLNRKQRILRYSFQKTMKWKKMSDLYRWLGISKFPDVTLNSSLPRSPYPAEEIWMGATLMSVDVDGANTVGMTFSCAACHVATLFGKPVFGLTTRFPRANEAFHMTKLTFPKIPGKVFRHMLGASRDEEKMFLKTKRNLNWVSTKIPQTIGLDTSLAQVGLSLALRENDPWASKTKKSYKHPRKNRLSTMVSDSKPAVWWNLKYKTRWLSDGSLVSGNPLYTNFLWNEIGRGTDLVKLKKWLDENQKTVDELTAAIFATEPPNYLDFFGEGSIDLEKAKKGEKIFLENCSRCHGKYIKGWSNGGSHLSRTEKMETITVVYHARTPVIDVGTDPGRYQGMKYFSERLNSLEISIDAGMKVEPQEGYVPPPLVGIWSRWPYFHNNSAPTLCDVLTPVSGRVKKYYAMNANNISSDFNTSCNGYPSNLSKKRKRRLKNHLYDTRKPGLSNSGHDLGVLRNEKGLFFDADEKMDLIEFLKTL